MTIRLYNTLSRKKEDLIPNEPGKIGMYVCGPTVYNYIHIGNARTFLNFDVIRRYLTWRGFDVTFVQNITDVDDKIINRAKEEGVEPAEVAVKYTCAFEEQMAALGMKPPTYAPRATGTIKEMIELVEDLQARGMAYETPDGVYFPVRRFAGYGKLSRRSLEEMRAGERVVVDPNKEDPMDFALWKKAKPGEPHWPSPWGEGRPGWHLECSAMSLKYLGMSFDIHGGAQDLIFPHHENEVAQSEGATGKEPFVRYWLHAGLLNIDKEKMSKSLGNFTLLTDVLRKWPVNVVRMLMLGTHYRNPLDFSDDGLAEAAAKLERIQTAISNINFTLQAELPISESKTAVLEKAVEDAHQNFTKTMDDDFNTAAALGVIFGLVRDANSLIEGSKELPSGKILRRCRDLVLELTEALGLSIGNVMFPGKADMIKTLYLQEGETVENEAAITAEQKNTLGEKFGISPQELSNFKFLDSLLESREQARADKNWALADDIRVGLAKAGVEIEDTPQGPRWKLIKES